MAEALKNRPQWHWIINLQPLIGRTCTVETTDGSYMKGTITGFQMKPLTIAGRTVDIPIAVYLNNDSTFGAEFSRMRSFTLDN